MGQGYYAELKKLLEENGCSVIRQGKGSHEIWYSPHTHPETRYRLCNRKQPQHRQRHLETSWYQ